MKFRFLYLLPVLVVILILILNKTSNVELTNTIDLKIFQETVKTSQLSTISLDMTPNLVQGGNIIRVNFDSSFLNADALKDEDITISGLNVQTKTCKNFTKTSFECILLEDKELSTLITLSVGNNIKLKNPEQQGNYIFEVEIKNIVQGEQKTQKGFALAYIEKNVE